MLFGNVAAPPKTVATEELVRLQLAYRLALAKGLHSRLGHDSPVGVLGPEAGRCR
eukprot:SAG31_NODE_8344_length_1469_cov_4.342336_2_plen_55_part_00